ncbi:MAG: alpha/beta hydrolase [Oscillospiraceae bacterium]|nr:alpha/beta hydrolase [Oscillospiraceae bacterium]
MEIREKYVPSTDGVHKLHGVVYIPDGEVKGAAQVVHGMAEYIGRYDALMRFFAEHGYLAFGHDHLGHGQTAESEAELGFLAHEGGWQRLVEDVDAFADAVAEEFPGKKRILFGHSMGSFIVRLYAAKYGEKLGGLIVMGTGGKNPAAAAGIAVAKLIRGLRSEKHVSGTVNSLAFGKYNDRTEKKTEFDWLSYDEDNVQKYIADPLCGFPFTVSAMIDLVTLNKLSNETDAFTGVPKTLPVLIVSGAEDPVGDYGKGPIEVADRYRVAGVKAVACKLYEHARHEILHESCRETVMSDLLKWIEAH